MALPKWLSWFHLDPNTTYRWASFWLGAMVGLLYQLAHVGLWGMSGSVVGILGTMLFGALHQLAEAWDAAHGEYGPVGAVVGRTGFGFSWRDVVMNGAGAFGLQIFLTLVGLLVGMVR